MFTRDRLELHQPDLGDRRAALPPLLKEAPPRRQLLRHRRRRIDGLIPQPSLKRLEIVLADELLHYIPPLPTMSCSPAIALLCCSATGERETPWSHERRAGVLTVGHKRGKCKAARQRRELRGCAVSGRARGSFNHKAL